MQKKAPDYHISWKNLLLAGILLSGVFPAGCTGQSSPAPATKPVVSIGSILSDPASFTGKEVTLRGKIAGECGSGCWFNLDDGTGILYVDLAAHNFAIPQLVGSTVTVNGIVVMKNGDPALSAASVATDSRTYP